MAPWAGRKKRFTYIDMTAMKQVAGDQHTHLARVASPST